MKWINYVLIILFVWGCSFRNSDKSAPKNNNKFKVQWHNYTITDSDSLEVQIIIKIPNKYLVFTKLVDHFSAKLDLTLNISHPENGAIIYRKVWQEEIHVPFYEDTRDASLWHEKIVNVILHPDEYRIFINIQDLDNYRSYKIEEDLLVEISSELNDIIAYIRKDNRDIYLEDDVPEDVDTVWCKLQINPDVFTDTELKFKYKILQGIQFLDSSYVSSPLRLPNNMVVVPIKLSRDWEGDVTLFVGYEGKYATIDLKIISKDGTALWSDDPKELKGVMAYLLSFNENRHLYELNEDDQYEYIRAYWRGKDPTPNSKKNELLEEMNTRVAHANTHYSVLGKGWRSDMGRIYIIYGIPETIDRRYNSEYGYSIEVWYYTSGKQFVFSDRSSFGEFKLVNEIN
jgi:GWxTD domain-containing protein